jgi:hypothetical protein
MEAELEESLRGKLLRTLELHTRLRFDPEGLDDRERTQLRDGARQLVEAIAAGRLSGRAAVRRVNGGQRP